jgi:hypothetical protein
MPARRSRRAPGKGPGRPLTREQILGADDRPRREGRGRPAKWAAAQIDKELAVAIAVEQKRREAGRNAPRTPATIFALVADTVGISKRNAERFFKKHRAEARSWASYIERIRHRRAGRLIFGEKVTPP